MFSIFRKKDSGKDAFGTAEEAVSCYHGGLNCTQAVLAVYGKRYGLDREKALKIAGAFGSGMGRGDTCGAVTGALMVIGLKHTKVKGVRFISKERTAECAREFIALFQERNGSMVCRDLLECDVSTREGLREARKKKHFKTRCAKYVRDAAELLDVMLKD